MFAQTHSLGPAATPLSALPGVRSGDNDDDNDGDDGDDADDVYDGDDGVDVVADEGIIDADNYYTAKPPGSPRSPSLPRLSPGCHFNWKLKC